MFEVSIMRFCAVYFYGNRKARFLRTNPSCSKSKQVVQDMFYKMGVRLTTSGFKADLTKLQTAFPKAEKYLMLLYHYRDRWAVAFSPRSFCVSSRMTNRMRGEHIACFTYASCQTLLHERDPTVVARRARPWAS